MAPIRRHQRTYSSAYRKKSCDVVDNLFVQNLAKRTSNSIRKRSIKIKELPPKDENHKLLCDSFQAETNDLFDKIAHSDVYHHLNYKPTVNNNTSESDLSKSLGSLPRITFTNVTHSPVLRKSSRTIRPTPKLKEFNENSSLKILDVLRQQRTFEASLNYSLCVEKVKKIPNFTYVSSAEDSSKLQVQNNSNSDFLEPSLLYFKNKGNVLKCQASSTPTTNTNIPASCEERLLLKDVTISPIFNKTYAEHSLEKESVKISYEKIKEWNIKMPDFGSPPPSSTPLKPKIIKNRSSLMQPKVRRLSTESSRRHSVGEDWKLNSKVAVKLDSLLDIMGITHSVNLNNQSNSSDGFKGFIQSDPKNSGSNFRKIGEEQLNLSKILIEEKKSPSPEENLTDLKYPNRKRSHALTESPMIRRSGRSSMHTFVMLDDRIRRSCYINLRTRKVPNSFSKVSKRNRTANNSKNCSSNLCSFETTDTELTTPVVSNASPHISASTTDHEVFCENDDEDMEIFNVQGVEEHSNEVQISGTAVSSELFSDIDTSDRDGSDVILIPDSPVNKTVDKIKETYSTNSVNNSNLCGDNTSNRTDLELEESVEPVEDLQITNPSDLESSALETPVKQFFVNEQKLLPIGDQEESVIDSSTASSGKSLTPPHQSVTISSPAYIRRNNDIHVILEDDEECSSADVSRFVQQFAIPQIPDMCRKRKSLVLKPGKSWRRSLSLIRHSTILQSCKFENNHEQGCTCACIKRNLDILHNSPSNQRRCSIRVVPVKTASSNSIANISILENYAVNLDHSYVSSSIHDTTLYEDFKSLSLTNKRSVEAVTARDIVLQKCGQTQPLPFTECYPPTTLRHCFKIGEGVYGEVFLFRNASGKTSVMKVIPIEGQKLVNGERQKSFDEILSEIVIAMEVSNLRKNDQNMTCGFSEVLKVHCVHGCYPDRLLELWELYDEDRGSENDSPEIFSDKQLYIILELANGGMDLEAFVFNNAQQAFALFKQISFSLAVAEKERQFEHRDLHWGNVLITQTDRKKKLLYRLDGREIELSSYGVEVSLIDFTLSRICYDGVCIYNDLSLDPELFTAKGDYQFDIYRLMKKYNGNDWQHFEPYTNVLWLHYVLEKMITAVRYKNAKSKVHKDYLAKLQVLKNNILTNKSTVEVVYKEFLT